jgi:hypothetical protein
MSATHDTIPCPPPGGTCVHARRKARETPIRASIRAKLHAACDALLDSDDRLSGPELRQGDEAIALLIRLGRKLGVAE